MRTHTRTHAHTHTHTHTHRERERERENIRTEKQIKVFRKRLTYIRIYRTGGVLVRLHT